VLVSLLEAELGTLLANCSAHLQGINSDDADDASSALTLLNAAERNKLTAAAAAQQFLNINHDDNNVK